WTLVHRARELFLVSRRWPFPAATLVCMCSAPLEQHGFHKRRFGPIADSLRGDCGMRAFLGRRLSPGAETGTSSCLTGMSRLLIAITSTFCSRLHFHLLGLRRALRRNPGMALAIPPSLATSLIGAPMSAPSPS